MSLINCIRKAGPLITKDQSSQIQSMADELEKGGLDRPLAELAAAREYQQLLQDEEMQLRADIEKAGGTFVEPVPGKYAQGLEGSIDDSGKVSVYHYSNQPLEEVSPEKAGEGADAVAKRRGREIHEVSYFGLKTFDSPYIRESSMLGTVENRAEVPATELYPVDSNPDDLWVKNDIAKSIENLRKEGFKGFWTKSKSLGKVATLIEKTPVVESHTLTEAELKQERDLRGSPVARPEDYEWAALAPKITSTNKVMGAPESVNNAEDKSLAMIEMDQRLHQYLQEGLAHRFWYEDSAKEVLKMMKGDVQNAEKFIQLLAIYSPQANVQVNTQFAINAWNQYQNGEEINVKTGNQDSKAQELLYSNKPWEGRKTDSFYKNLVYYYLQNVEGAADLMQLDAETIAHVNAPATIDLWMYRALDHQKLAAGDDKGTGKYSFGEDSIKRVAGQYNLALGIGGERLLPHQVQAAIWTAIKTRYEIPEVKEATWTESIEKGHAKLVDGKRTAPTTIKDKDAHELIWRKHAKGVESDLIIQEAERRGADFGDFIQQNTRVVTWEAMPSAALHYELFKASLSTQQRFQEQAREIITSEDGGDLLAEQVGVPTAFFAEMIGGYNEGIHPNTLSHLVPTKTPGAFTSDHARSYARAIQYIYKQDAVPFFRMDPVGLASKKAQQDQMYRVMKNGRMVPKSRTDSLNQAKKMAEEKGGEVQGGPLSRSATVLFNHNLQLSEQQALMDGLVEIFGTDAGFTQTGPDQITVVNFRDENNVPFMDDAVFLSKMKMFTPAGATEQVNQWVESEYGYEHDWGSDPEGKGITGERGLAERPDLQEWVLHRRSLFEELLKEYSGENLQRQEEVTQILQGERQLQQGEKGFYDPDTNTIGLVTGESNYSTFIHEQGHFFLEMERKFAEKFGVDEDQQVMLDYLGVRSFDELNPATAKGRKAHEVFARSFEAYAMEGNSPSPELQSVFREFRQWLVNLYKNIEALNVELTEDMKAVFDRMLATDEEIEHQSRNAAWAPLFPVKPKGMSKVAFIRYKEAVVESKDIAKEKLTLKLIDEYRKKYTAAWEKEAAEVADDLEASELGKPVYEALSRLKKDKLDYGDVMVILGHQPKQVIFKKGGADPQAWVEKNSDLGYRTAEDLLNDIDQMLSRKDVRESAEAGAQEVLKEKYGDILRDGTIEQRAKEELANEAHAKAVLAELKALGKKSNAEVLKALAKEQIGEMAYSELRPDAYRRNEIKAAEKAAVALEQGDIEEAGAQKLKQITNHYMFKEASQVKQKAQAWAKHIKAVEKRSYKPNDVATDYISNMKILARSLDSRANTSRRKTFESFALWYDGQMFAEKDNELDLAALNIHSEFLVNVIAAKKGQLLDDNGNKIPAESLVIPSWKDVSINDLKGIYDTLKHMRRIGGLLSDNAKAQRAAENESFGNHIAKVVHKKVSRKTSGAKRVGDQRISNVRDFSQSLTNLRNQVRKLDGFKETGMARTLIWDKVVAANNKYMKMNYKVIGDFYVEMKELSKIGLDHKHPISFTLENGQERLYTISDIFMLAVYMGTQSSREALLKGNGLTEQDALSIVERLSPRHLELVNSVWKINESIAKDFFAHISKVDGVAPEKLPPAPYVVNGVKMTGGHMQLYYHGARAELITAQGKTQRPSLTDSRAGSAWNRIAIPEHLAQPVDLTRGNIARSLDEKLRDMAFREVAMELSQTLASPSVSNAIQNNHGEEFYANLYGTIRGVVNTRPGPETSQPVARFSRYMRNIAVARHLMYSIRNTVQQFSAVPIAMQEVGVARFTWAAIRMMSGDLNVPTEKSEFMRQRAKFVNREATEFMQTVLATNKIEATKNTIRQYGFVLQTAVDTKVANPTWLAKYEMGMEQHGDESRAITDADTTVAESVGSGSDLHLGRLMQSNASEIIKTVGMFGSWFNMYYNRTYRDTKGFTEVNWEAVKTVIITPAIVAMLAEILVGQLPDEGEDPEDWMMTSFLKFHGAQVPVGRDILMYFMDGFQPSTPWGSAAKALKWGFNDTVKAFEGEGWSNLPKGALGMVQAVYPTPGSGQISRIWDGVTDPNQDLTDLWDIFEIVVEGREKDL